MISENSNSKTFFDFLYCICAYLFVFFLLFYWRIFHSI